MAIKLPRSLLPVQGRRFVYDPKGKPVVELTKWPLYSRQEIAAAGAQTVTFFRTTAGTELATNMTSAGQVPYPHSFLMYGISLFVDYPTAAAPTNRLDVQNLYTNSVLIFKISNKDYVQIPLHEVPSSCYIYGLLEIDNAAAATEVFICQNIGKMPFYSVTVLNRAPIVLPSQQDFVAQIKTFNAVAFTAAFNVTMHLHGDLARPTL